MPGDTIEYLVTIHIPFARDADGSVWTGDMWIKDLRGMAEQLGPITIAAPESTRQDLSPTSTGSFSLERVSPDDEQLRFLPIPSYNSAQTYLAKRSQLFRSLREYVERARVVHIDTGGWPIAPGQIAFYWASKLAKPTVLFLGDGADPIGRYYEKMRRDKSWYKKLATYTLCRQFNRFAMNAARKADFVFFHNPVTARRFQNFARRSHTFSRSFVEHGMVVSEEQLASKCAAIRSRAPLRLIMAGRLHPMKGVGDAIDAIKRVRGGGADVRLTIVGTGSENDKLRKQVEKLRLGEFVKFEGVVEYGDPMFTLIREHHALVVCNLTDEISRNVLLGMALGTAVICYENRALEPLLKHRENGIVCEHGSIAALAEGMSELDSNRRLCQEVIRAGKLTALQNTFEACHKKRAELIRQHVHVN